MADSSLFSSLAGAGISAATGNYVGTAIDLVGAGMSVFGGMSASSAASQQYQIQSQITGLEGQENAQRYQAMTLSAGRQSLQNLRATQQLRAQSTAAATNQGAQFGSGYQGGQAEVQSQGAFNQLGIAQNLSIGKNIFGLDSQISADKMQLSGVQSSMATDQGIASLGGSVMKMGDPLSKLLQQPFPSFGSGSAATTMGNNGLPAIS